MLLVSGFLTAAQGQSLMSFNGNISPSQRVNRVIDMSNVAAPLPQQPKINLLNIFPKIKFPTFPPTFSFSPFPPPQAFPSTSYPNSFQPLPPIPAPVTNR
jgi:hypothetical protein